MHAVSRLEDGILVVLIPMRLGRQRGRKRILAPDGSELTPPTKPQPDGVLVKALARAWRWQKLLHCALTSCWRAATPRAALVWFPSGLLRWLVRAW